jgi:predicted Zn-dependent peptidase
MRLILAPDSSRPLVASSLWYDAGSRDDFAGRAGMASLMEHVSWGETENLRRGEIFSQIIKNGGIISGNVGKDRTVFSALIPCNCLDTLLFLEAERMKSLIIARDFLDEQKAVMKEELKARFAEEPYTGSYIKLDELLFPGTPYARPLGGIPSEIDAVTLEDMTAFYRKFYVPRRATLALVGSFDPAAAKKAVEKYFATPDAAAPEVPSRITFPKKEAKKEVVLDSVASLPAMHVAFTLPERRTRDYYALALIDRILINGIGARLEQRLIYRERKAVFLSSGILEQRGRDAYAMFVILQRGASPEDVLSSVSSELSRLMQEPPSRKEMERARNRFSLSYSQSEIRFSDRANTLGRLAFYESDAGLFAGERNEFLKVTEQEVSAAAGHVFADENRSVLMVIPYR